MESGISWKLMWVKFGLLMALAWNSAEYTIIEWKFQNVFPNYTELIDIHSAWLGMQLPIFKISASTYNIRVTEFMLEDQSLYSLSNVEYDNGVPAAHLHYNLVMRLQYSFLWVFQPIIGPPISGYDTAIIDNVNGTYSLLFNVSQSGVTVTPHYRSKWLVHDFTETNSIARALGIYTTVKSAFETQWPTFASSLLDERVATEVQAKVKDRYEHNDLRIFYLQPPFVLSRPLRDVIAQEDRLYMRYGDPTRFTPLPHPEGPQDYAHSHTYSFDTLVEVYNRLQGYTRKAIFTNSLLPRDLLVRLDYGTFRQVLPDLPLKEGNKNLMAVLSPVSGFDSIEADLARKEVVLKAMQFRLEIFTPDNQSLLQATFPLTLNLIPVLIARVETAAIYPHLTAVKVGTVSATSSIYQTIVPQGMQHILQVAINDYLMPEYVNSTFHAGLELFTRPEYLNQTACRLDLINLGLKATLFNSRW